MNDFEPIPAVREPLCEIVASIAQALLGATTTPATDDVDAGSNGWCGTVAIEGNWSGAVKLRCSDSFARLAAAHMLGVGIGEVSDVDVRDAVGEITNIIGGNFKSLVSDEMRQHCELSLPSVVRDEAATTDASEIAHQQFLCDGRHLVVSVHRIRPGPRAAD